MSHSCSSPPRSPVLAFQISSTLDTKQSQLLEHSTSVVIGCATTQNTLVSSSPALSTPPLSVSSPRDNTLSSTTFSSSQSTQSSHPPSPSHIRVNSSPKPITSSHPNSIPMSTNQVVTRPDNPPLQLQENGAASSYSLSTAVSPNPREPSFFFNLLVLVTQTHSYSISGYSSVQRFLSY